MRNATSVVLELMERGDALRRQRVGEAVVGHRRVGDARYVLAG